MEKRDGMMMMMMEMIAMRRKIRARKGKRGREGVERGSGKVERGDVQSLGEGFWAARMGLGESWHEVNDVQESIWAIKH